MLLAGLNSTSLVELNLGNRQFVVALWLDIKGRADVRHFRHGPAREDTGDVSLGRSIGVHCRVLGRFTDCGMVCEESFS